MSCIFVCTIEITSVPAMSSGRSTSSLDIHCIVNKTLQYHPTWLHVRCDCGGYKCTVVLVVMNAHHVMCGRYSISYGNLYTPTCTCTESLPALTAVADCTK